MTIDNTASNSNKPSSNTLCAAPWNHFVIQQNGSFRACCLMIQPPEFGILKTDDQTSMNILTHSIDETRNSLLLKNIRKQMVDGEKPHDCNLCWELEDRGLYSHRMNANDKNGVPDLTHTSDDGTIDTSKYPLKSADLRFGNLCNQACRSCGSTDSSLWYKFDTNKSFEYYGDKVYFYKQKGKTITIDSEDFAWFNKPNFEVEIKKHLPDIKRMYFTGGEPTINKAHFKTLQLCIDEGVAGNISLDYNSNLMVIPEQLIEKWSHFKWVGIGASIDAYGDLANYVRYPSKWHDIENNINYLGNLQTNNLRIVLSITVTTLNILNLLDLVEWSLKTKLKNFSLHGKKAEASNPPYLCIQNLPLKTKDMINQKYQDFFVKLREEYPDEADHEIETLKPILDYMYAKPGDKQLMRTFFIKMFEQDRLRKQSLFKALPWTKDHFLLDLMEETQGSLK